MSLTAKIILPGFELHCTISTAGAVCQRLLDTMYRDRATVFHRMLGWDLRVDDRGWERDEYDAMDPLYLILALPDGAHGGSLRLMPTTAQTMLHDHFLDLLDGVPLRSSGIWEVTRLCVAPRCARLGLSAIHMACILMIIGAEFGLRNGLEKYVGVCEASTYEMYQRCGWTPTRLGVRRRNGEEIWAGLWAINEDVCASIRGRLRYSPDIRWCCDFPASESTIHGLPRSRSP